MINKWLVAVDVWCRLDKFSITFDSVFVIGSFLDEATKKCSPFDYSFFSRYANWVNLNHLALVTNALFKRYTTISALVSHRRRILLVCLQCRLCMKLFWWMFDDLFQCSSTRARVGRKKSLDLSTTYPCLVLKRKTAPAILGAITVVVPTPQSVAPDVNYILSFVTWIWIQYLLWFVSYW